MKKILVILMLATTFNAHAGLDEKIAASFAAKYQVCALKLKNTNGYRLKSVRLKAKSDEINREQLGDGGYLKAFLKEKSKARWLSLKKCKKLANKL